jgi:RNA polymerase sigma-70 factor (ECF subfamily)
MLAAGHGDMVAFGRLVTQYQKPAWSIAYRFLGNAAEAEDAVQEAFVKILKAAPHYKPTASFQTYLYRVVARVCMDRTEKKHPDYVADFSQEQDTSPSVLDKMDQEERDDAIRAATALLPPNQRMAVVLRYFEGLSHREVASAMGISEKAVERLLARARSTLESRLSPFLGK